MDDASFQALQRAQLYDFTPDQWAGWYPRMAGWLDAEDGAVRLEALERLVTGVFWSEPRSQRASRPASYDTSRSRAVWLLEALERRQADRPELLPAFLEHLRWNGGDEPFPEILLPWLGALRKRMPDIPEDRVEGAIILIGGLNWSKGAELPPQLDHPSNYVRACAARMLGSTSDVDADDNPGHLDAGLLAELTAKELARPGLLGPFWTSFDGFDFTKGDGIGFDPVDWMLDIIERRNGPEPADLAFNGLDFHIHELAAENPDAVRRLARAGRADLALMTATEMRGAVDGMAPALRELATQPDPAIAHAAHVHLALYYAEAHPAANPDRLRHLPNWRPAVDTFVIRYGDDKSWIDVVAFFPMNRGDFDDAEAWSIIDAALPPDIRGDLAEHYLARGEGPGPLRLGRDELRCYASGGQVTLSGDPDGRRWRRLEIAGSRLQSRWRPLTWTTEARP